MSIRLGDAALDGVIALLKVCIHDAAALGDNFDAEQWVCLYDVLDLDVIGFELSRLSDGSPKVREMERLVREYREVVFPDPIKNAGAEEVREACPLFADQVA